MFRLAQSSDGDFGQSSKKAARPTAIVSVEEEMILHYYFSRYIYRSRVYELATERGKENVRYASTECPGSVDYGRSEQEP